MIVRRATADDAALLAEHRRLLWLEVAGYTDDELTPFIPVWLDYFRRRIADGMYVSFVAEEANVPIASGGFLVRPVIPRPEAPDAELSGRVQNIYVLPSARRRGAARAIMDEILAFACDHRFQALSLHASDQGRELYRRLGFRLMTDQFELRLFREE